MIEKLVSEYITDLEEQKKHLEDELTKEEKRINEELTKYQNKVGTILYKYSKKKREEILKKIDSLQANRNDIGTNYLDKIEALNSEINGAKYSFEYALSKVYERKPEVFSNDEIQIEIAKTNPLYLRMFSFPNDKIIEKLYAENKELFANPEFMESLVKLDYRNIVYDLTDNDKVYDEYVSQLLNKIDKEDYYFQKLIMLKQELDNPRQPEEGMYKIPHKFLFESLRKKVYYNSFEYGHKVNKAFDINDYIPCDLDPYAESSDKDYISRYLFNDCKHSLEYGKQMEELYSNPNNYLLIASCNPGYHDKIFEEGYMINPQYSGNIYRNFWDVHGNKGSFLNLFKETAWGRSEIVYVTIPKNEEKILGSDGNILDLHSELGTYLLPEFVYGVSVTENGKKKLIKNDIPLDNRKKYKNVDVITYGVVEQLELSDRVYADEESNGKSR